MKTTPTDTATTASEPEPGEVRSTNESSTYRSVEHFAAKLRKHAPMWTDIRLLAFEFIKVYAQSPSGDDTRDMMHVRNIVAAAELVRAELDAR